MGGFCGKINHMGKIIETWLQKSILFIGGLIVFFILFEVEYSDRYTAILKACGILVFLIILMIILQGYRPIRIINFIKRHKKAFIILGIIVLLIGAAMLSMYIYSNITYNNTTSGHYMPNVNLPKLPKINLPKLPNLPRLP